MTTPTDGTMIEEIPWLSPSRAAKILGVSVGTIQKMRRTGKLRYRRKVVAGSVPYYVYDPVQVEEIRAASQRV